MKFAALLFIASTIAFGGDNRDGGELTSGADFLVVVKAADRVEIDIPQPSPKPLTATHTKAKNIESLLALFRFSDVPLRGQKVVVNDEEAWIVAPCQCLGDYRLRFFEKDTELITVTFHHEQFIRVEGEKGGAEFDLLPESGAKVRDHLDALMKKRANCCASTHCPHIAEGG
jgi:hypothetical protein